MNRRTFITSSTAAAIGFGANSILTASAQEKEPMDTSTQSFWPDKARLVISISMQLKPGLNGSRSRQSLSTIDPKYPDLAVQKWYEYGFKEGIPRMLDMWDRVGVKVTSHMVGKRSKNILSWQRRSLIAAMKRPGTARRGSRNTP